jgi:hypothetical protein
MRAAAVIEDVELYPQGAVEDVPGHLLTALMFDHGTMPFQVALPAISTPAGCSLKMTPPVARSVLTI